MTRICRYLEAQGVPTRGGNPGWVESTLHGMLQSRVYLGEIRLAGRVYEGAHPALVDPATCEKAQKPRQLVCRAPQPPVLLAGMIRCTHCSMAMSYNRRPRGAPRGSRAIDEYYCRQHFTGGTCPTPAFVSGQAIEDYVTEAFFSLLARRRRPPVAALRAAEERQAQAYANLSRYRDNDRLRTILGDDAFTAGVATRMERLRDARLALADAQAHVAAHELPRVPELRKRWPTLATAERKALIARVIDCVFISRGRHNLEQRVTVCPTGTMPSGLSRRGHKAVKPQPVKPRRGWMNPTA